ncbi:Ig-like domain-containing protein [Devosia sp. CN2-171]|uniref:Ig-like domain-containing protein n=1 Tax=Devosia sp. CN2-171 TaxID=3400909 RepID=UPI003BF7EA87
MPSTTSVGLTGNPDIDGLLSNSKWADPNLTFSFPTLLSQYGYSKTGFEPMNSAQQTAVRAILDMIESYTGLNFTEVTESATVHGTLRFGEEDNAGTAYAYMPTSVVQGGDVWLNHTSYENPLKGTYSYLTFIHEIGHALGLDHGQDGLAALPTDHDSLEYSVMTYRSFAGAPLTGYTVKPGSYPTTLMLDDIAALQYLYGANYSTNAGNTTYTWSATTGEMFVNGVGKGASTANKIFMTLWDGDGIDTYDFSNYTTNLIVDLSPGGWTTTSTAQLADLGQSFYPGEFARGNIANAYLYGGNTASLIENAKGGSGNDTIVGNQANNTLWGNDGADTLTGAAGNDTIYGGNGIDYCVLAVNYVDCVVTYDASAMTFLLSSTLGLDTVSGVEYFTFLDGTYTAASLMGSTGGTTDTTAPTLTSTTPADNASSVAVNANLVLRFNETVVAGTGSIVIRTAAGVIVAAIAAADASQVSISGGTVTINPTADLAQGQSYYVTIDGATFRDAASNYFAGLSSSTTFNFTTVAAPSPTTTTINGTSSSNTLNGTSGADTINGLGGNDTLKGLAGNDTLDGGTGRDSMSGGSGNDTYVVDNSEDRVTELSGEGTDTVKSSVSFTLGSNIENLTLTGSSSINGTGNSLANVLTGNGGANVLSGSSGNDTLNGKLGIDTLSGGSGKDTFVFDTALGSTNIDRISDFNVTDDTIALSKSVFAALSLGNLDVSSFFKGTAAADATDRLIYNSMTGALYYDPDGVGGVAQLQISTLSKSLALTAADFLIIA